MNTDIATQPPPGLIQHAMLDRAFRAVLDAFGRNEPEEAIRLLTDLAAMFRSHLDAEDLALDAFAKIEPDEAVVIRREHVRLRAHMDRLMDLARYGTLVANDVYRFKAKFSLHEAHEERVLY